MRNRLIAGLACVFVLLVNVSLADNGPLLFDGPPLPQEPSAKVRLSSHYQQPARSPFEVDELPPTPVPVPMADPKREKRQPADAQETPGWGPAPEETSVPEVPAEPPVEEEERAASKAPLEVPMQEPSPHEAPEIVIESPPSESVHEDPGVQQSEPDFFSPVSPRSYYDDTACDCGCSPRPRFCLPPISYADLTLPELPQPYVFDEFGVELGGWLDAGFSAAGTSPADRFNGPVTFNDRHAEGQMNQLWFYLERKPNAWACGLDLGGRIDVMYGTDAQFIQAADGLEANWDQSERFYQAALPQFYLDATLAGWTVRMGRFFTILGYETPAAPDNFFYSHAYTMQYGEPFTHTGMLVSRRFGNWLLNAGFHRGNDQFDDTDGLNALNVLGGIGYKLPGDLATVEYAFSSTENGPGVLSYTHSMVNTVQLTEKAEYVLQGDYGQIWNETYRRQASWWGLNQYLTYTINPCWAAAVRVEWFRDRDGNQVSGIRAGNQTPTGLAGDFYEITLGLNWKPRTNLRIRPEVRWDFFDPAPTTTNQAYDAGDLNRQFTFGCDVVYKF